MRFYKSEMEKELLIAKIKKNPSLLQIFKKRKDITRQVNQDIEERMRGEIENFVTIFITGQQGCHLAGTNITTKEGLKKIEDITIKDKIWNGKEWANCKPISKGEQEILKITLNNNQELFMTPDHQMLTNNGWKQAKNFEIDKDSLKLGNIEWTNKWNKESEKACLIAMLLADGHLDEHKKSQPYKYKRTSKYNLTKKPQKNHKRHEKRIRFYKSDKSLREYFNKKLIELGISNKKYSEYKDKNTKAKVISITNQKIFDYFQKLGAPIGKKSHLITIPKWIQKNDATMNGFLAGYFACDGSYYKNTIEISSCSKKIINQLISWLQSRGIICKLNTTKRKKPQNNLYRLLIRNSKSLKKWEKNVPNISKIKKVEPENLENKKTKRNSNINQLKIKKIEPNKKGQVYDLSIEGQHQYLANGLISHNSWKSSTGQQIAIENDDTIFDANKICFTYQEFRDKFEQSKPKEWFIMDEQVFLHGTGSGRIVESIQTLIETLRQRQNSMIIISPESKYFPENIFTYVMETIDRSILGKCKHNQELHEIRTCPHRPHTDINANVRLAVKKDNSYIGFYITPIAWNTPLWKEYYKRKIEFNTKVLTENFQKVDYEKLAQNIIRIPNSKEYKTSKQLMLLLEQAYPNLSVGEKNLVIEAIKIERKKQNW